jgi:hypothetical protein
MDIVDILGGLLGRKSRTAGRGPDILKDILNRGRQTAPDSRSPEPDDIERQARELEDMLNVSVEHNERRRAEQPRQPERDRSGVPADDSDIAVESPYSRSAEKPSRSPDDTEGFPSDERAVVLVRAMINSAKADGRFSSDEQQSILKQFGSSPEATRFLREELSKPLNVREFADSVPVGMENQVYTMSLIAINVDTSAESAYLRDLAQSLRISDSVRDQLHQRYGVAQLG